MSQEHTLDRRSHWNFVITDTGWLWTIARPDGTEERSASTFTTLKHCADDAIRHGYGAWKHEERRQVEI